MDVVRDFISKEAREFRFKVGHHIASSLSGFIVGVIVASLIWWAVVFSYLAALSVAPR